MQLEWSPKESTLPGNHTWGLWKPHRVGSTPRMVRLMTDTLSRKRKPEDTRRLPQFLPGLLHDFVSLSVLQCCPRMRVWWAAGRVGTLVLRYFEESEVYSKTANWSFTYWKSPNSSCTWGWTSHRSVDLWYPMLYDSTLNKGQMCSGFNNNYGLSSIVLLQTSQLGFQLLEIVFLLLCKGRQFGIGDIWQRYLLHCWGWL